MTPAITFLDCCSSTNTELAALADAPEGTVVATHTQSAGRGQRGNSWEAEPGCNLTFSMLLRPVWLPIPRQFELSMVVSLAIADALSPYLPEPCIIKWPNDIYCGLRKLCGILIEHKLSGSTIDRSIVGIGINVNQTTFVSDAPNPTSLALETGRSYDLSALLREVTDTIARYVDAYAANPQPEALRRRYMARLLWTAGAHPFRDAEGAFTAHITDVDVDGTLTLSNGRRYAFKEVAFIIQ